MGVYTTGLSTCILINVCLDYFVRSYRQMRETLGIREVRAFDAAT